MTKHSAPPYRQGAERSARNFSVFRHVAKCQRRPAGQSGSSHHEGSLRGMTINRRRAEGSAWALRHTLSKSSTEFTDVWVITPSSVNHLSCESGIVQSSGTVYAIYLGVKRTSRPVGECHETKGTDAMSWPVMFISSFVPIVLLFMLRIMDWLNGVFRSTATR